MPAPRYITSDTQMIAPGVYVKENAPAVPIRGQRNRVIGLGGQCLRGPTGKLVACDSYQRFIDVFGGRDRNTNGGTIVGHVWRALQRLRWGKIYVVRIAAADAVKASYTAEAAAGGAGTPVLRIDAANVGAWGNDLKVKVTAATNANANYFNLRVKLYGVEKVYENLTIFGTDDNTNQVIGNDDATLITLTKLAAGRPVNNAASTDGADADGYIPVGTVIAGYTTVAGTDGTIANGDYTAADGPIDMLNNGAGIHACAIVGRSNTTIKTAIAAAAAIATQRVWFVDPDDENVTVSAAVTERATFNNGRLSYWFNHCYVNDPITLEEITQQPFLLPMSIISQTDPDVHVGDLDNVAFQSQLRRCKYELSNSQRDTLTTGGVSFNNRDQDLSGNDIILPGNAVTCDFAINNRELDGRYMKDFILDAIAQHLRGSQFKGNTPANRAERASAVSSFLDTLARSDRYILRDELSGRPQFQYVNNGTVNTREGQAAGTQKELLIATLIPKNIRIQLNATIGVDAVVTEQ